MKFKDWLSEWLEYYVKPRAKYRTQALYEQQISKHIIPELGEYELDEISAEKLQRFVVNLMEEGLSSNSVNGIINILNNSLQIAANLEKIKRNYTLAPKHYKENAVGLFEEHSEEEQNVFMKKHCAQYETEIVICYCHYCLEGLIAGGVDGRHLAELLFK